MTPIASISSDTTSDLGLDLVDRYGISLVPLYVSLGDKTYRDGADVTPQRLYDFFSETGSLPKTAAPSPADFMEVFRRLTAGGKGVVHLSISSDLSAAYNNACIAAKKFENVFVADSENLSTGIGLCVLKGAELAKNGLDANAIFHALEEMKSRVESSFVIDTLTYLHKGGRCSSVAALGSNLLKIKPCIEVRGGKMVVGKKYQGTLKKCLEKYIRDRLCGRKDLDLTRVFITHTLEDLSLIEHCRGLILQYQPFKEVLVTTAGSTIASHCGPNTLGVLFLRKDA